MKKFTFFQKKKQPSSIPLWSTRLQGRNLEYKGEDIESFLLEFECIEDEIILFWNLSRLTWKDYQDAIDEVQQAKQRFVRFAYH